jgi:hypothetical protein
MNKLLKNLKCFFGLHEFKQVGDGFPGFRFFVINLKDTEKALDINETFDVAYCENCQLTIMKRTTGL